MRDFWNTRYGAEGYAYGTAPNDFLASVAGRLPAGRALCLAEGEGRNAVFLAERGYAVTAVDFSAEGLRKAEALAGQRGQTITTVEADLGAYDIEVGAWDVIVSIFAHTPPAVRRRIHEQAVRGLKPGGAFVLEAYTPAQIALGTGGPKDPTFTMSAARLCDELEGLRLEQVEETMRDVREGTYHTGRAHVVQVLGWKPEGKP